MASPKEGNNPIPADTTARQTLAQLRARWGSKIDASAMNHPPDFIEINGMTPEMWLRDGDGKRGGATTYTLEREWRP